MTGLLDATHEDVAVMGKSSRLQPFEHKDIRATVIGHQRCIPEDVGARRGALCLLPGNELPCSCTHQ